VPNRDVDSTAAFHSALTSGATRVLVPAGEFTVSSLAVPDGVHLSGAGHASVLRPGADVSTPLLVPGSHTRVQDLRLEGHGATVTAIHSGHVRDVDIVRVWISDFAGMGIESDHTEDLTIEHCRLERLQRATNLQFSNDVRVLYNTVADCTEHGIQFWGNWRWEHKQSSNLQFIGNRVTNGGGGAIWGAGGRYIVVSGNLVDGAEDVGIDLEWCEDATVTGNFVRRAKNGGISLFFACERVSITGNTVLNDRPISEEEAAADWWARSGIWLTYPNRETFPQDFGHRDVTISGNTVVCTDGERRGIWIGSESRGVTVQVNTLRNGGVWYGGAGESMREVTGLPESEYLKQP
jgi:hypothetical protein